MVFAYWDEIKRHRYATWRDVLPVYAEAVADDARLIDPNTRLRWTDSPADQRSLAQCAAMDRARLAYLRSAFTVVNGYRYRLAQL